MIIILIIIIFCSMLVGSPTGPKRFAIFLCVFSFWFLSVSRKMLSLVLIVLFFLSTERCHLFVRFLFSIPFCQPKDAVSGLDCPFRVWLQTSYRFLHAVANALEELSVERLNSKQ